MKKSRIFMGVAALSLVVAGVFANKTAKKATFSTLYYGNGTLAGTYALTGAGCLLSIFTKATGTEIQAKIEVGSGSPIGLYYYTGSLYKPVYNFKF